MRTVLAFAYETWQNYDGVPQMGASNADEYEKFADILLYLRNDRAIVTVECQNTCNQSVCENGNVRGRHFLKYGCIVTE